MAHATCPHDLRFAEKHAAMQLGLGIDCRGSFREAVLIGG
jgi:hypothetical protein